MLLEHLVKSMHIYLVHLELSPGSPFHQLGAFGEILVPAIISGVHSGWRQIVSSLEPEKFIEDVKQRRTPNDQIRVVYLGPYFFLH